MSPSELRASSLGVFLEKEDRTYKRNAAGRRLRFFRFGTLLDGCRFTLDVKWHTKVGAWQAALRWVKRLKRGELR